MKTLIAPALLVASMLAVLLVLFAASSSAAADYTVTRADDPAPGACDPDDCSLREAANAAYAASGRQLIDVPDGMTVTLTRGELHLNGDMTIAGHGNSTSVHASSGSQIIVVDSGGDAILQDIKIAGATVGSGCGAGIANLGTLQLLRVTVDGNTITGTGAGICNSGTADINMSTVSSNHANGGPGAGIYNSGTMTIESSTITGNTVTGSGGPGDGGGIHNAADATLTVDYSTISNNTGGSPDCNDCSGGAGIRSDGTATINHSTLSGNHSDNSGAFENRGTATVLNSTVSGNDAGSISNQAHAVLTIANSTISGNLGLPYPKQGYGGIGNYGTVTIARSTVADNTASGFEYGGFYNSNTSVSMFLVGDLIVDNGAKNCSNGGNIVSQGGNVITDSTCHNAGGDHVVAAADVKLGALADNGGTTLTRALGAGSVAIDAGSGFQCSFDQRGAPRPVGSACDAGAFEFGGVAPTLSPSPSPTPAPIAYPMGDATCDDHVTTADVTGELRLIAHLDSPSDCGRTGIACLNYDGACYPVWTNPDCNDRVDGADVLPILAYLTGHPLTESCTQVGEYPTVCDAFPVALDGRVIAVC